LNNSITLSSNPFFVRKKLQGHFPNVQLYIIGQPNLGKSAPAQLPSRTFKRRFFLVKQAVWFRSQPVLFDPYLLVIWLDDGLQRNVGISNTDRKVIDYVYEVAASSDSR
jgi:hypothetical protein